jgi:catechol 2,3-dioxygenase-like lactoylglutathione lyase family enzyme
MPDSARLSTVPLVAFVPINDKDQALAFYRDKLGLFLIEDQSPFALVFDAHGTMIRATFAGEFKPQPFTVLGWHVSDIGTMVRDLGAAGIEFNHYPWMGESGSIWTAPGGSQIAWFNDPFGNVLSLQQSPAS